MGEEGKVDDAGIIEFDYSLSRYERFLLRDRALWGSIWPFLNTRLPSLLPFQTSFCRGQGKKRRLYGEVRTGCVLYITYQYSAIPFYDYEVI